MNKLWWWTLAVLWLTFLVAVQADDLERKSFLQDLKDSVAIHKLIVKQQRTQRDMDDIAKRFAVRNHCPSTRATLNGLGFLICQPVQTEAPKPEAPKPAPAKTQ